MRITMIIREMVRSFRRSLWVNLLMTVQMSICFFLVITMMTYYFDVGNSQEYIPSGAFRTENGTSCG